MSSTKMSRKRVGIVGYGYVGKVFERFFKTNFDVVIYDIAYPEYQDLEKINECDLAVFCLPTISNPDGSCDTSIVEKMAELVKTPLILIKSAIVPGTTDRINTKIGNRACVSPEYAGEGSYFTPFWKYPSPTDSTSHGFFILGGPEPAATAITEFVLKVMGPDTKVLKMSAVEAEITKYIENSWGATKVTFANEFYEICNAFGADFQKVREGWVADPRVERMHTMVLSDKRGFGGKCFPKDVAAILHASSVAGYRPKLLEQVLHSNEEFIQKNI